MRNEVSCYQHFIGRLIKEVEKIIENFNEVKTSIETKLLEMTGIEDTNDPDMNMFHCLEHDSKNNWSFRSHIYFYGTPRGTEKIEIVTPISFSESVEFLSVPVWVFAESDDPYAGCGGAWVFASEKHSIIARYLGDEFMSHLRALVLKECPVGDDEKLCGRAFLAGGCTPEMQKVCLKEMEGYQDEE